MTLGGREQELQVGENSPPPSQIKQAYELVKKKFTGKSSVDESMARQLSMELIQESSTFEYSRKTTFIDMKKRPLPPEPSPNGGGHVGGHGNDSDEDLHDYERVEDGSPSPAVAAWKLQKPLVANVRRAKLDSMSPSPHHAPGIPADGIRAANSMDSYMNADGLGDGHVGGHGNNNYEGMHSYVLVENGQSDPAPKSGLKVMPMFDPTKVKLKPAAPPTAPPPSADPRKPIKGNH